MTLRTGLGLDFLDALSQRGEILRPLLAWCLSHQEMSLLRAPWSARRLRGAKGVDHGGRRGYGVGEALPCRHAPNPLARPSRTWHAGT